MTVLTVTIADQVFDKKSSEAGYICRVLEKLGAQIQRTQGAVSSGTVLGTNAVGTPNSALATYTYTASGSVA